MTPARRHPRVAMWSVFLLVSAVGLSAYGRRRCEAMAHELSATAMEFSRVSGRCHVVVNDRRVYLGRGY